MPFLMRCVKGLTPVTSMPFDRIATTGAPRAAGRLGPAAIIRTYMT